MNLAELKNEIISDPLGRGYSGMSNLEIANDLNTVYRTRNRSSMSASEVFNAIDKTELNTLDDTAQQKIWNLIHMGSLNPFGLEQQIFVDVFGGGSTTISTLANLRIENISRATELGFGTINEGDIIKAKAYL